MSAADEICDACNGDGYLICQRTDGWTAIETCDACQIIESDEEAAVAARKHGYECVVGYPAYLIHPLVNYG